MIILGHLVFWVNSLAVGLSIYVGMDGNSEYALTAVNTLMAFYGLALIIGDAR